MIVGKAKRMNASPSLVPQYECPACGCEYNKETAQAKGLYCGCAPLVFMRKVRP